MSGLETVITPAPQVPGNEVPPLADMPVVDDQKFQGKRLGWLFWASVTWLVVLVLAAIFADLLPLKDPGETFRGVSREGPSADHWFGADNIGHDVFSRTIYGARRSLAVATIATMAGLTVGGFAGLVAGFYRRNLDTTITAILNVMLAIPSLVLLLALVAFFAPAGTSSPMEQTMWATIGLSIVAVPTIARVARAQTMVWSDREFVLAARTLGTRNLRMMVREILPNVLPAMFSIAFIALPALIVAEAALAFLGVGDVSGVSWGIMIQNGRSQLDRAPHMVLFPSLFMFITILALNTIGDRVRDVLDVKEGGV